MDAIKTIGLTKKYKDVIAVSDLNISISKGELFALLGVNGAGKTTTIKMLSCLTSATDGNAFIMGNSILDDQQKIKPIIAVSPQENAVARCLTVKENLDLICGVYGITKDEKSKRISEITELLRLNEVINKKASKLSGGYQRRLNIAMALISKPQILFLDEPTLGLDVIARSDLWDIIRSLKGRVTIVLTTHYMEEAQALSDRIAIMKSGKLLICDTAKNIMEKAETDNFEQAFIRIVKEA